MPLLSNRGSLNETSKSNVQMNSDMISETYNEPQDKSSAAKILIKGVPRNITR